MLARPFQYMRSKQKACWTARAKERHTVSPQTDRAHPSRAEYMVRCLVLQSAQFIPVPVLSLQAVLPVDVNEVEKRKVVVEVETVAAAIDVQQSSMWKTSRDCGEPIGGCG